MFLIRITLPIHPNLKVSAQKFDTLSTNVSQQSSQQLI